MKSHRQGFAAVWMALLMLVVVASCGDDDSTGTPQSGSIAGTVTFRGTWPASGEIYITVFAQYPPTGAPDAFTNPITQNQLGPGRTFNYKVPGLEAGTYKAVLIGWRAGIGQDQCTGLYWNYPDSVGIDKNCIAEAPGPSAVTVIKNQTASGVNMVSDLSLIEIP
ncbi:MAG TPA: hypothetical protein VN852_10995 [Candidatus Krumholzibacteria bacterium]|nr:hypothetical protein [Candidatus Krumholzibacteria bacterium]